MTEPHGVAAAVTTRMANGDRLEVWEVAELSRSGVPDEVVLTYLKRTKSVYLVTADQASAMRRSKVSDAVVEYLRASPKRVNFRFYPKGYIPPGVCRPAFVRQLGQ